MIIRSRDWVWAVGMAVGLHAGAAYWITNRPPAPSESGSGGLLITLGVPAEKAQQASSGATRPKISREEIIEPEPEVEPEPVAEPEPEMVPIPEDVAVPPPPLPEPDPIAEVRPTPEPAKTKPTEKPKAEPQPPKPLEKPKPVERPNQAAPSVASSGENGRDSGQAGIAGNQAVQQSAGGNPGAQQDYLHHIRLVLERNKRYPSSAKRRGQEGTVTLDVRLSHTGVVESASVLKSSGVGSLDRAALETIERSAPFPPFPKDMKVAALNLHLPITFVLQ